MVGRRCIAFPKILVLSLLILAAASGIAAAATCPKPSKPPEVLVEIKAGDPVYDHSDGVKTLTRRARDYDALPASPTTYSTGLTHTAWETSARMELQGRPFKGSHCWSIVKLDMKITGKITVYIAKEIMPDSCAWREVDLHEQKHVDYNKNLWRELRRDLPAKLSDRLLGAETYDSDKAALADFEKKARAALQPLLNDANARHQKDQQRKIDTAAEYDRVHAACLEAEWQAVFTRAGLL